MRAERSSLCRGASHQLSVQLTKARMVHSILDGEANETMTDEDIDDWLNPEGSHGSELLNDYKELDKNVDGFLDANESKGELEPLPEEMMEYSEVRPEPPSALPAARRRVFFRRAAFRPDRRTFRLPDRRTFRPDRHGRVCCICCCAHARRRRRGWIRRSSTWRCPN